MAISDIYIMIMINLEKACMHPFPNKTCTPMEAANGTGTCRFVQACCSADALKHLLRQPAKVYVRRTVASTRR